MTAPVTGARVVLVGEANPYGTDPRYALYCEPRSSAGGRLCHDILRMTTKEYIRTFERVNLCPTSWKIREARRRARELALSDAPLVLFGSKVCAAFGMEFSPFLAGTLIARFPEGGLATHVVSFRGVVLPHPSGLCRLWGQPPGQAANFARARTAVMEFVSSCAAEPDAHATLAGGGA